jgi:hypothetical protein
MEQEPTLNPLSSCADPANEAAAHLEAGAQTDTSVDARNQGGHEVFATAPDVPIGESALSSVAAAMTSGRTKFLQILSRAVDADISPAVRRSLHRASNPASDEAAAFEWLVDHAVEEAKPSAAATICAALAARTVARTLLRTDDVFALADVEALLAGWLDAARAVAAARGTEGLCRLLPAARQLARRTAGRGERAAEIAAAMRRVAGRIAAGPSFGRTVGVPPQGREHDRTSGGIADPPPRFAIQS